MSIYKILFLEDNDEDKKRITGAADQLKGISLVHHAHWEAAEQELKDNRFDLVIADVMIYRDKADAENRTHGQGMFPCIEPLLKIVESHYPPTPVVIYTGKETLRSLEKYQPEIVDFWGKDQVSLDFIRFRITKIRDAVDRDRPNSQLIRVLKDALSRSGGVVPWATDINMAVNNYEQYGLKGDRELSIETPLSKIADTLGIVKSFNIGIHACKDVDTPAGSLLAIRPHYHHSINVFLLGYYLFNLSNIKWPEILLHKSSFNDDVNSLMATLRNKDEAIKKAWLQLNSAWFVAALLHDSGLIVQKYSELENKLIEIVDSFGISDSITCKHENKPKDADVSSMLSNIKAFNLNSDILAFIEKVKSRDIRDHGLASSIFIAKQCYEESTKTLRDERKAKFTLAAAEAVAIHNRYNDTDFPQLDFAKDPIAAMMIFCDAIQAWDRDIPDSAVMKGNIIDKVELLKLDSSKRIKHGPKISFVVRYYPYILVSHYKPIIDDIASKLQKAIHKNVTIPLRQKINFTAPDSYMPFIKVDFELMNIPLATLELPGPSSEK